MSDMERNANRVVMPRIDKLGRALGMEMQSRIMDKTPVDTGRARANWNASVGEPDGRTTDTTSEMGARARAAAISGGFKLSEGRSFFVSSGLEYIEPLEEGSSKQAPSGMVRVTIHELAEVAKRIGARLNRG